MRQLIIIISKNKKEFIFQRKGILFKKWELGLAWFIGFYFDHQMKWKRGRKGCKAAAIPWRIEDGLVDVIHSIHVAPLS